MESNLTAGNNTDEELFCLPYPHIFSFTDWCVCLYIVTMLSTQGWIHLGKDECHLLTITCCSAIITHLPQLLFFIHFSWSHENQPWKMWRNSQNSTKNMQRQKKKQGALPSLCEFTKVCISWLTTILWKWARSLTLTDRSFCMCELHANEFSH